MSGYLFLMNITQDFEFKTKRQRGEGRGRNCQKDGRRKRVKKQGKRKGSMKERREWRKGIGLFRWWTGSVRIKVLHLVMVFWWAESWDGSKVHIELNRMQAHTHTCTLVYFFLSCLFITKLWGFNHERSLFTCLILIVFQRSCFDTIFECLCFLNPSV